jgi:signal transduction histidine kinase
LRHLCLARIGAALLLVLAACQTAAAEPRRVLVLHSFGPHFSPWRVIAGHFREELIRQSRSSVDLYEASLQSGRFGQSQDEAPFIDYLRALFAGRNLDLVVAMGAPAARFFLQNRSRLFPTTPLLITGADERTLDDLVLTINDTAVGVWFEQARQIENILQVLPDTTTIAVATGASPIEQFWVANLRRAFEPFTKRVRFEWLNDLSLEDMLKRVANLPPHSAIYYNHIHVDARGVPQENDRALSRLHEAANAPIFSFVDSNFGLGIVGGPLVSTQRLAQESAVVAVRILSGETPGNLKTPPLGLEAPMYDWRELQRWNIGEARLPPGSIVQFREPTVWQRYRWVVMSVLATISFLVGMIAWLLFEHHKRRKAELESRRRLLEVMHLSRTAETGALSVSFAHELSQPLASIMLNAETAERLLEAEPPNVARAKEILGDIRQTDGHATEIISHVKKLLKRRSDIQAREFDLSEAIADAMQILVPEAKMRNVALRATLIQRPLPVRADSIHLQQVILNLARNGMDAMADIAANARRMTIQTALLGESTVELSVSDSGTGIPDAKLSEVFDTFYTTKEQGTGLGLSIARTIVETYGGEIRAENRPLGGAVFRFTLPLLRPASTLGSGRDVHGQRTRETERQYLEGPSGADRRRRLARGQSVGVEAGADGNACHWPNGDRGGS